MNNKFSVYQHWDGGIHCVTTNLDREGTMQDYFTNEDK